MSRNGKSTDMTDDHTEVGTSETTQVEFHMIKSNHYRVIHVDGGMGGITPRGFIHFALYNERAAIPKVRVIDLLSDDETPEERTIEVLGEPNIGVVREIEVDLLFNEQTAREIHAWLERRIEEFEKAAEIVSAGQEKGSTDEQH